MFGFARRLMLIAVCVGACETPVPAKAPPPPQEVAPASAPVLQHAVAPPQTVMVIDANAIASDDAGVAVPHFGFALGASIANAVRLDSGRWQIQPHVFLPDTALRTLPIPMRTMFVHSLCASVVGGKKNEYALGRPVTVPSDPSWAPHGLLPVFDGETLIGLLHGKDLADTAPTSVPEGKDMYVTVSRVQAKFVPPTGVGQRLLFGQRVRELKGSCGASTRLVFDPLSRRVLADVYPTPLQATPLTHAQAIGAIRATLSSFGFAEAQRLVGDARTTMPNDTALGKIEQAWAGSGAAPVAAANLPASTLPAGDVALGPAYVSAYDLAFRKAPASEALAFLPIGTRVDVLSFENEWAEVETHGRLDEQPIYVPMGAADPDDSESTTGFVARKYLSSAAPSLKDVLPRLQQAYRHPDLSAMRPVLLRRLFAVTDETLDLRKMLQRTFYDGDYALVRDLDLAVAPENEWRVVSFEVLYGCHGEPRAATRTARASLRELSKRKWSEAAVCIGDLDQRPPCGACPWRHAAAHRGSANEREIFTKREIALRKDLPGPFVHIVVQRKSADPDARTANLVLQRSPARRYENTCDEGHGQRWTHQLNPPKPGPGGRVDLWLPTYDYEGSTYTLHGADNGAEADSVAEVDINDTECPLCCAPTH